MANIMDYLNWRGDLSFAVDPMNEVDSYILAKIGCPDYTGIVPEDASAVTVSAAVETYFTRNGAEGDYFGALASQSIGPVIRRLPETVRFGSLWLGGFVKRLDADSGEQFSALTILLPDGTPYVSFRGTDDTLLGWKENMQMAVRETIPAQEDALRYLLWAAENYPGDLIVGGHSKGGNLAVYAAAAAPEAIQRRIRFVDNFDGPGFAPPFFRSEGYQRIRDRIHTLLPQYSIVGMLLPREEDVTIIRSGRAGIAAHDGFVWEVLGPRFVHCDSFSRSTIAFEESMQTVLQGMDTDARLKFIEELFDTLAATGAETITDVTELGLRKAMALQRSIRRQPEIHRFVTSLLELMLKDYASLPFREEA